MNLACYRSMQVAAEHPERVTHLVVISPATPLSGAAWMNLPAFHAAPPDTEGWNKYNAVYWRQNYPDFVQFFCRQIANKPHSTKQIEDMVSWGLETTPEILIATIDESATPMAACVRCNPL